MQERGFIYKGKYEGWYCTVDEVFVPETQLVDGRCPICGSAVEKIAEESYFFKLSAFQEPLLDHYRAASRFRHACRVAATRSSSFLEAGLEDLSVSRTSFKWGIPVPDDPAHVMYVWFDALTNYMTAVGYGSTTPRARDVRAVLAGRRASDRQGNRAPARDLLAGVSDGGRSAAAEAARQPWLVADGRREDVQVDGQRRPAARTTSSGSASTRFAISCCARWCSARTPTSPTRRSSRGTTPISRTIWATWSAARRR